MGPPGSNVNYSNTSKTIGYITEKMYVLLQLYLQNKNWSPSVELLQCFNDLKESSMLPNASYLQMLVTRIGLNNQGRLILRENGKLIVPYEQFANAVMMKHLEGPHGIHLTAEGTIRAIVENFTIGKEQFGMEKEFIIEMVQNCPNPTCRYYKTQSELSQKTISVGSLFNQDPDTSSTTLMRSSYSFITDFQSNVQGSVSSHTGSSLSEASDNRNISQRSHSTLLKKISSKLFDSSTKVVPTSDSYRLTEFLRTNIDNFDNFGNTLGSSLRELTSLDNGIWSVDTEIKSTSSVNDGQEKIIRTFAEVMKNMQRMKSCVRPAMCKPYGKQSETLQKTLIDTIQLIQSLRSFLPPPHIPVSS